MLIMLANLWYITKKNQQILEYKFDTFFFFMLNNVRKTKKTEKIYFVLKPPPKKLYNNMYRNGYYLTENRQ